MFGSSCPGWKYVLILPVFDYIHIRIYVLKSNLNKSKRISHTIQVPIRSQILDIPLKTNVVMEHHHVLVGDTSSNGCSFHRG